MEELSTKFSDKRPFHSPEEPCPGQGPEHKTLQGSETLLLSARGQGMEPSSCTAEQQSGSLERQSQDKAAPRATGQPSPFSPRRCRCSGFLSVFSQMRLKDWAKFTATKVQKQIRSKSPCISLGDGGGGDSL